MEIAKGKIGNALTSTASDHVVAVTADIYDEKQERYQEDINEYLLNHANDINDSLCCFSEGIWENNLYWSNVAIWDNNKYALTDALSEDINTLSETHKTDTDTINKHLAKIDEALLQNSKEHDAYNVHLEKHDTEIKDLQKLIAEHDQQITDLLYALSCFNSGQWENDFKWSNDALWENSNFMCNTFEDVYRLIEEHQQAITQLSNRISEVQKDAADTLKDINSTFDGFRKEHDAFRKEHQEFAKEHDAFRTEHQGFTSKLDNLDARDIEQQREIDTLLYRISILTNGQWDNTLLWINDSNWVNYNESAGCECPIDTGEQLETLHDNVANLQSGLSETDTKVANNEEIIAQHQDNLSSLNAAVDNNASEIEEIQQTAVKEHRSVAYQFRAIGRDQATQDEKIAKIGEHFNCFADGIWNDMFIWDNEQLWANQTGVLKEVLDDLQSSLHDTRQKLHEANEDIMTNLSLIQANHQLIESNIEDIQENKSAIQDTQSQLDAAVKEIHDNALTEHRSVAYQLRAIGREQTAQDENIAKLGEHFGCFVDGQWGNLFLWNNDHLWNNNVGVVTETLSDINSEVEGIHSDISDIREQIENHVIDNENTINEICAQSSIFDKGEWSNPFFWNDSDLWFNTPDSLSEVESDVIRHDDRISALEAQFALFAQQYSIQQAIIEQQRQQIETLMECFTVLNVGKWQNLLLWDNTSKWSDSLITEVSAEGGIVSVAVKSYDPETATVSI